ncbi:MAG: Gfo/Idh/MocA family oxidoreductase [Anaerolineaceae bacterium]|nr:Gfo/Idh/MocA family oxidoreductase [Anaerolineaceae bacterium]
MAFDGKVNVLVIGGGMICEEATLPAIFQQRKTGNVGQITIVSLNSAIISRLRTVFPDEEFEGLPDPATTPADKNIPDGYKECLKNLESPGLVYVTTPDHLHTQMILDAIAAGHDVVSMKPLCLKVEEGRRIVKAAGQAGAYVFTEYHKRLDRAIRGLRYRFRRGELGEPLYGHAWIEEPKYMPLDKFKAWAHRSSPFEYIGTHYVDVWYYVTGLKPRRVVGFGQKKYLPGQGSDAYDANQVCIEWEDGSVLWVQTSWVIPDNNSRMTQQGLMFAGTKGEYKADHADRNCYFTTDERGFEHYNPNFVKPFDDWTEEGVTDWRGYGIESNSRGILDVIALSKATDGLGAAEALAKRKAILAEWVKMNTRALPENAMVGVAVNNAARMSFDAGGKFVTIDDDFNIAFE